MYNQQSGSSYSFANSPASSQYRGRQQQYKPVGMVQSQYGQNQFANAGQIGTTAASFHTANYKGNQANHDQYLRSDSANPSSFTQRTSSNTFNQSGFGFTGTMQTQYQPQSSFQTQNQFHTANYQGNQPGHDNYLRSDSSQPSSFQAQSQAQSFHTANYQGNQAGHDNYLRSDSNQPTSRYGSTFGTSFNRF